MREDRAAGRTTAIGGGGRRKSDESLETVRGRMAEGENSRETDRYGVEREMGFTFLISFYQALGELDT